MSTTLFVNQTSEYNKIQLNYFTRMVVTLFHSEWHQQSQQFIQMLSSLSQIQSNPVYVFVNADNCNEICNQFNVQIVPTLIISDASKNVFLKLENPSPPEILSKIEETEKIFQIHFENQKQKQFAKIDKILAGTVLHVYIKGTAEKPKCKFTRALLEQLEKLELNFSYYDILQDEEVRNWNRLYASWKTYPQVWINGKIVGGLDVVTQLIKDNKFLDMLPDSAKTHDPVKKFETLTKSANVLALIEGVAGGSQPLPDKSQLLIKILQENHVKFSAYNILSDKNFQSFVQQKFNISEFPAIFIEQKLLEGGVNKMQELAKNNQLISIINANDLVLDANQKVQYLLDTNPIVCFINGNITDNSVDDKSKQMLKIIDQFGLPFQYFNVDADEEVRNEIIDMSKDNSFPQLYHKKLYIGNLKSIQDYNSKNELLTILKK